MHFVLEPVVRGKWAIIKFKHLAFILSYTWDWRVTGVKEILTLKMFAIDWIPFLRPREQIFKPLEINENVDILVRKANFAVCW